MNIEELNKLAREMLAESNLTDEFINSGLKNTWDFLITKYTNDVNSYFNEIIKLTSSIESLQLHKEDSRDRTDNLRELATNIRKASTLAEIAALRLINIKNVLGLYESKT